MTDVLTSPPRRTGPPQGRPTGTAPPRPVAVSAIFAVLWAGPVGALACAALAVVGWLAAEGGTAAGAIRVGVDGWLVVHRVPLSVPGGTFGLTPLGLTAALLFLLYKAGLWVGRTSGIAGLRHVALGTGVFAVAYGGFAALVAAVVGGGVFQAPPQVALVQAAVLAAGAGGAGLLISTGRARALWGRVPEELRSAAYAGCLAACTLLAGATVLYVVVLLTHAGRVGELAGALAPGLPGGVLLALLCLAYLPNAIVFTAAYALGPGFSLGSDTIVAPTVVELGPLPTFPLLAAVPAEGTPPALALAVLGLPFAGGVAAGVLLVRRHRYMGIEAAGLYASLAGLLGGLGITVLSAVAGGPGGPGRMVEIGPASLRVGIAAVMTFAVAAALMAMAVPARGMWLARRARAARVTGGPDRV